MMDFLYSCLDALAVRSCHEAGKDFELFLFFG